MCAAATSSSASVFQRQEITIDELSAQVQKIHYANGEETYKVRDFNQFFSDLEKYYHLDGIDHDYNTRKDRYFEVSSKIHDEIDTDFTNKDLWKDVLAVRSSARHLRFDQMNRFQQTAEHIVGIYQQLLENLHEHRRLKEQVAPIHELEFFKSAIRESNVLNIEKAMLRLNQETNQFLKSINDVGIHCRNLFGFVKNFYQARLGSITAFNPDSFLVEKA